MDVFVHDRLTGTTERVSVATGGVQGDIGKLQPWRSRRRALRRLRVGRQQPRPGRHQRQSGTSSSATARPARPSGSASERRPQADGSSSARRSRPTGASSPSYVATATNLVPATRTARAARRLRPRPPTGTTERVEPRSARARAGRGPTAAPARAISADGRFVAFVSAATNLVPGDTNGALRRLRPRPQAGHDRAGQRRAGRRPGARAQRRPVDLGGRALRRLRLGRHQPRPGRHQRRDDVFVRDRQTGTTERVSVGPRGARRTATASTRRSRRTGASWPSTRTPPTSCRATPTASTTCSSTTR